MNCRWFSNRLIDFLEGLLPHSEEIRMKEHIKKCEICRAKLEKIKRTTTLLKEDAIPPFGEAKKKALFPLVMKRIEQRLIVRRKKRKLVYALSFGCSLVLIFIVSVIGIKMQKKNALYTLSINPDRFIYENDSLVNNYIAESLIKNDTLFSEIKNRVNEELIDKTELTVLVDELSDDEMDKLAKKLRDIDFKNIL